MASRFQKLIHCIIHPGWRLALAGALLLIASMLYAFVIATPPMAIACICYCLSACCLVIDCVWLMRSWRKIGPAVTRLLRRNPVLARCISDPAYRLVATTYLSLFINVLYVLMNIMAGLHYGSSWSLTLAGYYLLLAIMRFLLLRGVRVEQLGQNLHAEYYRSRLCGSVLLLMNIALTSIVVLAIRDNVAISYPGYLIYAMALYAFYAIIVAFVSLIQYRRFGSPIMTAAKVINLSAALVSMLLLEMAMITTFDDSGDLIFRGRMIGITGLVISVLLIAVSTYTIVRAARYLSQNST